MEREPYTYSLPEQFLEDQSVPARWRVWAVINGFFINGGSCWASNEWIATRIKSHKDTVSQAVKELEDKGIIKCQRGARSRTILPMIGANTYQWSAPTPISDRHQRLSNSVKNSERESSVAIAPHFEVVEASEEEPRSKKPPKYPNARTVFSWFPSPEPSWLLNKTELAHAELLFARGRDAVKQALKFHSRHEDYTDRPQITKPSDLERKWNDLIAFAERNGL